MNINKSSNSNKAKFVFLCIVFVLSVGAMAYFAIALALDFLTTRQGSAYYAALSIDVLPRSAVHALALQNPSNNGVELLTVDEITFFIDFDAKRETMPGIVGWIQSEGTVINYPIVQGRDNEHYLYHLPDGRPHIMGSIFMDYRNSADFSDQAILIYGHDMRSGDMFGSFRNYASQSYFEQHYSMYIFTPYQNFVLMLLAGYVLDSAYEVPPMRFNDEADFDRFMSNIRSRSIFRSEVQVQYGAQIVFLATCTPTGSIDERLIIVGKLIGI